MSTAPSFRLDPMTERWVAMAPGRAVTSTSVAGSLPEIRGDCPFCPGNEAATDRTIDALPAESAWRVRVVRNLFPVVTELAPLPDAPAFAQATAARGIHEIVIEQSEHARDFDVPALPGQAGLVMRAYRDRIRALMAEPWCEEVAVFRNRGRRAGSSQPHAHGQLAALPFVAPETAHRHAIAMRRAQELGEPLLDVVVRGELAARARILEHVDAGTVLVPYASHRRFETWVVPSRRIRTFADLRDDELDPFGAMYARALERLARATGGVDFNVVFRQAPIRAQADDGFAAYIEIAPRTGGPAGFELATGIDIVTLEPEVAADMLRRAG